MKHQSRGEGLFFALGRSLIEALILALLASAVAVGVSFVHPRSIPLIAKEPIETMVPCAVGTPVGHADAAAVREARVFLVDARDAAAFDAWHAPGATRLTYDFLDPVPASDLDALARHMAAAGAAKVLVYGDGGNPDTGVLLAQEISSRGIRHVYAVRGGATAVMQALQEAP